MTPNFALSLSFEGIRLLHRTGDEWTVIGDVAVDEPDLAKKLGDLRKIAEGLEPGPLRTKLVLPNEQIKFTAIDSTMTSDDDVNAALEGTTPYQLHELVIDHDRSGGRTHIAAVAKETLDEAEAFAVEHGFNPVAFVANAEPLTFRSEVFFGETKAAQNLLGVGEDVTRDEVMKISSAPFKAASAVKQPAALETKETHVAAPPAETVEFKREPEAKTIDKAENSTSDDAGNPEEAEVLFTRRDRGPILTASRDAEPKAAPAIKHQTAAAPVVSAPKAPKPEPKAVVAQVTEPAVSRTGNAVEDADAILGRKSRKTTNRTAVRGKPRYLGLVLTVVLLLALLFVALWANTLSEDGIAGWYKRTFNVVELQPPSITPDMAVAPVQGAEPSLEAEVATTVPSPSLPIVRAPQGRVLSPAEADRIYAATGVYQRAPRLPITPRETTLETFNQALAMPAVSPMAPLEFDGSGNFVADAVLDAPSNPPPAGTRYLRDLRGFILAMPDGVVTPEGALLFAGSPDILPPARPGTPEPALTPVASQPEVIDPDAFRLIGGRPPIVPPLRPEGLAPEIIEETETAPAEIVPGETQLADTIDLSEPTPEVVAELEDPVTEDASLDDPVEDVVAVVVTAGRPEIEPPLRPASFADLQPAEPEAATTALTQELEPEDISAQADDIAATFVADPSLAGFRPTARPSGALSDAVIAALTASISAPVARPEATPTEPAETDVSAVAAAIAAAAPQVNFSAVTASAIPSSVRPDSRPRNFSQVVARAQAAASRQTPAPTATVASAPAVASGPVPGGVARAATVDNAIRLRNLNLIGVYGRSNDRRALVRLSNGRYVKVEVGSQLDGGRVTAINDSALNYVKNGRTVSLELPSG